MFEWKDILIRSGIPAKHLTGSHTSCPLCGGKDRFRFDNKEGRGTWICGQCEAGTGFKLLQLYHNITYEESVAMIKDMDGLQFHRPAFDHSVKAKSEFDKARNKIKELSETLVEAKNTPAEIYLNSRGLEVPRPFIHTRIPKPQENDVRRSEIQCYFGVDEFFSKESQSMETFPTMAWKVFYANDDVYGYYRTLLAEDGKTKANVDRQKRFTSKTRQSHGFDKGDYQYCPLTKGDSDVVILGEGIETTLSAHKIMKDYHSENCTSIALLGTGGVKAFAPRTGGNNFMLFADRDLSFAGQLAAATFAHNIFLSNEKKYSSSPNTFRIAMPDEYGIDWNDILINGSQHQKEVLPFNNWI